MMSWMGRYFRTIGFAGCGYHFEEPAAIAVKGRAMRVKTVKKKFR